MTLGHYAFGNGTEIILGTNRRKRDRKSDRRSQICIVNDSNSQEVCCGLKKKFHTSHSDPMKMNKWLLGCYPAWNSKSWLLFISTVISRFLPLEKSVPNFHLYLLRRLRVGRFECPDKKKTLHNTLPVSIKLDKSFYGYIERRLLVIFNLILAIRPSMRLCLIAI